MPNCAVYKELCKFDFHVTRSISALELYYHWFPVNEAKLFTTSIRFATVSQQIKHFLLFTTVASHLYCDDEKITELLSRVQLSVQ
jgi:hypothetical protein